MTSIYARLAVATAFATFGILGASGAQAQSSEQGWSKSCRNINGSDHCTTHNAVIADNTGVIIISVGLLEIKPLNKRSIQIAVQPDLLMR